MPVAEPLCPPTRWIALHGSRIAVHEEGPPPRPGRPAVVFLHGFGAAMHSWAAVLSPLADARHVVAFDRPGFGASPLPADPSLRPHALSTAGAVEATTAVLDACGLDRAVLVGHSQGGAFAAETALAVPRRVAGLALVDAAIGDRYRPRAAGRRFASSRAGGSVAAFVGRGAARVGPRLFPLTQHLVYERPEQVPHQIFDEYRALIGGPTWTETPWEVARTRHEPGLDRRIADLDCPTLVLAGRHDRVVVPAVAQQLAERIPAAHLVLIPSAGHNPQEERPADVVDALRPLLDRV